MVLPSGEEELVGEAASSISVRLLTLAARCVRARIHGGPLAGFGWLSRVEPGG